LAAAGSAEALPRPSSRSEEVYSNGKMGKGKERKGKREEGRERERRGRGKGKDELHRTLL